MQAIEAASAFPGIPLATAVRRGRLCVNNNLRIANGPSESCRIASCRDDNLYALLLQRLDRSLPVEGQLLPGRFRLGLGDETGSSGSAAPLPAAPQVLPKYNRPSHSTPLIQDPGNADGKEGGHGDHNAHGAGIQRRDENKQHQH